MTLGRAQRRVRISDAPDRVRAASHTTDCSDCAWATRASATLIVAAELLQRSLDPLTESAFQSVYSSTLALSELDTTRHLALRTPSHNVRRTLQTWFRDAIRCILRYGQHWVASLRTGDLSASSAAVLSARTARNSMQISSRSPSDCACLRRTEASISRCRSMVRTFAVRFQRFEARFLVHERWCSALVGRRERTARDRPWIGDSRAVELPCCIQLSSRLALKSGDGSRSSVFTN